MVDGVFMSIVGSILTCTTSGAFPHCESSVIL